MKVNEAFSDFLRCYPIDQELRGEMLKLAEKRVARRLASMSRDSLERYFIGQQLRVDITAELTKVAMLKRESTAPIAPLVSPEPTVSRTTAQFSYEKRGNVLYLPFRPRVRLS